MSRFVQIHLLTSYPPANLNRDDQGRPKTAKMGGYDRLRVSSQSLKRAWRTSDLFQQALTEHVGTRTKLLGVMAYEKLVAGGVKEKQAKESAQKIAGVFGALKKAKEKDSLVDLEIEQLVHVSPSEIQAIESLLETLISQGRAPEDTELDLLRIQGQSADIAMFGRMLASSPSYNVEAACQVAHAISVHPVVIEDDYFTAVDDLNDGSEDAGAAHIGETGFAAGLFYSYICINRTLLVENLGGDEALVQKSIQALIEAAVKVPPNGKQNSFGSRAYASYVLAEKGDQQPRSLSVAFLKPVTSQGIEGTDFGTAAVDALTTQRQNMDAVYGPCADASCEINVFEGKGTLAELLKFVAE
ncbi:type I-E CRISPR-associated protein Cas7/Cse4/CasC [Trichlorobacter lovleyi]|uniref:CRISPR-associated protein, Cse4 family n=1 Tax=Trichlorobacter lovleyi (strain ATCC BAA-1151 / DSM 17278 / SZ) TaxID=398767 RepID=B3E5V0_TRIL1|nr:type I-E CRISPR-associated protein Cas7/Cse4/CasC [Trichlorobacter lovleyi]ACD96191.1 CRISPR-associated protein, Cse4 family [Trichlorobacter lovleyi SZ]